MLLFLKKNNDKVDRSYPTSLVFFSFNLQAKTWISGIPRGDIQIRQIAFRKKWPSNQLIASYQQRSPPEGQGHYYIPRGVIFVCTRVACSRARPLLHTYKVQVHVCLSVVLLPIPSNNTPVPLRDHIVVLRHQADILTSPFTTKASPLLCPQFANATLKVWNRDTAIWINSFQIKKYTPFLIWQGPHNCSQQ